jgi:GT2 family glycosyltransferase
MSNAAEQLRDHRLPVSAVILTYNRERSLRIVLERLAGLPLDEVVVIDNGSEDGTTALVDGWGGNVRRVDRGENVGLVGRNTGVAEARNELVLMLDDDSYPLPGAIGAMVEVHRRLPRAGVVGGWVIDIEPDGQPRWSDQVGTFDWFLRMGRNGDAPAEGFPAIFFPAGGCMVRREAFLECGGYYEPFFFTITEVDLATRMLGAGWDVRYLPAARFEHMKEQSGRVPPRRMLRYAVRNQIWYFWRHFPAGVAARRVPAYLLFDLILCTALGAPGSWGQGIVDAWRSRATVRGTRAPLERSVIRRAELKRGRLHVRLVVLQARKRVRRRLRGLPEARQT